MLIRYCLYFEFDLFAALTWVHYELCDLSFCVFVLPWSLFLSFQSSLKTTFRTLVVSRLPSLESPDEPSALTVMAVTKERNKRGLDWCYALYFFSFLIFIQQFFRAYSSWPVQRPQYLTVYAVYFLFCFVLFFFLNQCNYCDWPKTKLTNKFPLK